MKWIIEAARGGKGAPMSCAIIYWGKSYNKFYNIFIKYGAVVDISPLIKEKTKDGNLSMFL